MLSSDRAESWRLLADAFATGEDPAADKFVSTYLFTHLELPVAPGITAEFSINRDAVGLALAELKQDDGDLLGAIDVVERLEPTTYSAVSLAELYSQVGRWEDVIDLSEGITNDDGGSALLCVYRGEAFREQGYTMPLMKHSKRHSGHAPEQHRSGTLRSSNEPGTTLPKGRSRWPAMTSSGYLRRTPTTRGYGAARRAVIATGHEMPYRRIRSASSCEQPAVTRSHASRRSTS